MKKITKIISALLSVIIVGTVFTACGSPKNGGVNNEKTQLYINNYDGGFGDEWLYSAKAKFEEKYENTSFEEGKTGVQVWITASELSGPSLMDSVKGAREHIFIAENIYYYDYLTQNVMLDITDVLTTPLTEFGETKTIASKLQSEQDEFLKVNDKYYAIPHYFGTNGIIYDVELFDSCNAFLDAEGNFTKKSTDKGLSLGADGVAGTSDDGLPATYEEFYKLCKHLQNCAYTPVIWSGEHQFNVGYTTVAIAAEANGASNTKLLFDFNGTSDRVIKEVKSNGTVVYETNSNNQREFAINQDNGYKAYAQAGNYYALQFMKGLINGGYCHSDNFTDGVTAQSTQETFVLSNKETSTTPIAMLVDGNWWENEASDFMKRMEDSGRYQDAGRMSRKFGFMPLPKPNSEFIGEKHTLLEANNSYMFIRADIEDKYKEVAKLFLKFINTDESLSDFSVLTNTPKALKYDMSATDLNKMSYFGKNFFEYKNSAYTEIVYQCSTNELYYNNLSSFDMADMYKYGDYNYPSFAFNDYPSLTAKQYYDGYVKAWETKYNNMNK